MQSAETRPVAWITGAGGLIGHALMQVAPQVAPAWRVHGLTRPELDLLNADAVRALFERESPQLILHCAALTETPVCEQQPALAQRLNVDLTAFLARLAREIPFVLFSTDLVFDGRAGNYDETAPVHPLSIYARTKVSAEEIVLSNPRHTVVRTSLNAGVSPTGDRAFNEKMRMEMQRGREMTLFTDEFRCPIPAVATARAVWELMLADRPGLYHVAGSERLSRWQIGQLLAACWPDLQPKIQPGSLAQYRGAPRSPDTSLNSAKAQKLLSFALPRFSQWVPESQI